MNIRLILSLLVASLIVPLSLAAAEPAVPAEVPTKTSPKDMLLTFLLDKAKSYSGTIEEGVTKAVDFAKEQTPLVVEEFLTWRAWMHGVTFGLWAATFITSLVILRWTWGKSEWDSYDGPSNLQAWVFIGGWIVFVVGLIGTLFNMDNLFSFIQIQVAPRVYLIEEVSKMIK